ncbi:MAG: S9 family peptidase [Deltaproteobacteria bacterium]|nr:S9 family peptidase [Deltaproteobacteria bacterium]
MHRSLNLITVLLIAACAQPQVRPQPRQPLGAAAAKSSPLHPWPSTAREPVVDVLHGQQLTDPYRWLEEDSPRTKAWLAAQDGFARRQLAGLAKRDALKARIAELSYVDQMSAPSRRGKRFFYWRQHADKEKRVYYWRQGADGVERVLLDPNKMSEDGSVAVSGVYPTYDGKTVAYKLNQNAADDATLYVMDVASGQLKRRDVIEGAKYAHPSWTPRGDGFYYTRIPKTGTVAETERPGHAAVYFHKLGTDPASDPLVHEKTGDPRQFIHADLSRDGRYLLLYVYHGWTRTDVYFKDLRRDKSWRPFRVGVGAKYDVVAHRKMFYVRTDEGAPNWMVFRVDPRKPQREAWTPLIAEQAAAVLESIDVVGGHLSLTYLNKASSLLKLATTSGEITREVALPGIGSSYGLVGDPDDDTAYFSFSSFIQPPTIYRTSVRRGQPTVYAQTQVKIDPQQYGVEQVVYKSRDQTSVTMFVISRKDLKRDGTTPFLLYGYGGFNVSLTPQFRAEFFAWLEQGAAIAIPNLRGGGEYGEKWHQAGMLANKQNVFDDFISAAEYLIAEKYTRADRLAIRGGSNGGLLVGAAMTQRPELFRAVACHVPLLDMLRYHRFGAGKTWISEYGSADNAEQFRTLVAYSPYHRVKPAAYPALLMLTADSDDRVHPMHARKFTAAIQHATTSGHPVWLRMETNAGHGGGDMIKKTVAARADEFAFLLSQLGL